jgi:hypothetical protein
MDLDAFINSAIILGGSIGVGALDPNQRLVFLISEAEVLCDMEGIDSFLDRYDNWLAEAAAAFEAVGASAIAEELRRFPHKVPVGSTQLDRLNELITGRVGYDYETIRRAVTERQA